MNCYFCSRRYTKKRLCAEFVSYDIMRRLFRSVLYDTYGGGLFLETIKTIKKEKLFSESKNIEKKVDHYLAYLLQEFDVYSFFVVYYYFLFDEFPM